MPFTCGQDAEQRAMKIVCPETENFSLMFKVLLRLCVLYFSTVLGVEIPFQSQVKDSFFHHMPDEIFKITYYLGLSTSCTPVYSLQLLIQYHS